MLVVVHYHIPTSLCKAIISRNVFIFIKIPAKCMQSRQFYCMHHAARHPAISLPHLLCVWHCSQLERIFGSFSYSTVTWSKWPARESQHQFVYRSYLKKKRRKWSGIWLKAAQEGDVNFEGEEYEFFTWKHMGGVGNKLNIFSWVPDRSYRSYFYTASYNFNFVM